LCHTIEHLQRNGDQVLIIAPDGGITDCKGARCLHMPLVAAVSGVELCTTLAIGHASEEFQL